MAVADETDDVRDAIRLITQDQDTGEKYAYVLYIDEGLITESGFRHADGTWQDHELSRETSGDLKALLARIREADSADEEDADGKWNAAVITYDRAADKGALHVFHGTEAEDWDVAPGNHERITDQIRTLFG